MPRQTNQVAVVGTAPPPRGGISDFNVFLVDYLDSEGFDVRFITWKRPFPQRLHPRYRFSRQISSPSNSAGLPNPPLQEAVLTWWNPLSWLSVGLSIRKEDRLILFSSGTELHYPAFSLILGIQKNDKRKSSKHLCHNVTPHESNLVARLLRRLFGKGIGPTVIHSKHEIDIAQRYFNGVTHVALPFHSHVRANPVPGEITHNRLLFLGFIRPYKGVDHLLRALANLNQNLKLVIAGECWDEIGKYQYLVDELNLSARVTFINRFVSDAEVEELLDTSDALVLPYISSTASQLPHIALRRGVPVIATRVGSFPEIIKDGVNGILVEPDSISSLSDAIQRFYKTEFCRQAIAQQNENLFSESWQAYLHKILT